MRTPTIMLVDDEPAVLQLMAISLERQGWEIHRASDAATALTLATDLSCRLNVLVADLHMPGMTGEELIQRVRQLCPYIDILAISGALPEGSAGLPAVQFLPKPLDMRQLAETISEMLSRQLW